MHSPLAGLHSPLRTLPHNINPSFPRLLGSSLHPFRFYLLWFRSINPLVFCVIIIVRGKYNYSRFPTGWLSQRIHYRLSIIHGPGLMVSITGNRRVTLKKDPFSRVQLGFINEQKTYFPVCVPCLFSHIQSGAKISGQIVMYRSN